MAIIFKATVVPPFRNVSGAFAKANKQLIEVQRSGLRTLGELWYEQVQKEAPVGRTGKFRTSHSWRTFETSQGIQLRTYAPQPLATWITKGTKPHLIVARKAKALRFLWENGPRSSKKFTAYHFYTWVWHPGTKPNDYLGRVHRAWMPFAREELNKMGRKVIMELKV